MEKDSIVEEINSLMQAHLDNGMTITVTGEEETHHFHCVRASSWGGIDVCYGRKTKVLKKRGYFSAEIDKMKAVRLLKTLERGDTEFKCTDFDFEPLTIVIFPSIRQPDPNAHTFTKKDEDGNRIPSAFVDFEEHGKRFGMLTILYRCGVEHGNRKFVAVCDCGGYKLVPMSGLIKGDNISCGCQRGKNRLIPLEAGEKFNMLTVVEMTEAPATINTNRGSYYRCKCDCGNEYVVSRYDLTTGKMKSCGCKRNKILKNMKFGKLTVLDKEPESVGKYRVWECKCEFGNLKKVSTDLLTRGQVKSCGCMKRGRKPKATSAANIKMEA